MGVHAEREAAMSTMSRDPAGGVPGAGGGEVARESRTMTARCLSCGKWWEVAGCTVPVDILACHECQLRVRMEHLTAWFGGGLYNPWLFTGPPAWTAGDDRAFAAAYEAFIKEGGAR